MPVPSLRLGRNLNLKYGDMNHGPLQRSAVEGPAVSFLRFSHTRYNPTSWTTIILIWSLPWRLFWVWIQLSKTT